MKDPFTKQLLLNLGIITASIIGAAAAFYFILSDVHARAAVIAQSQAAVTARNSNLTQLASLEGDAPAAATYEAAIAKLLHPRDDLLQFPHQIQTLGETYNVGAQAAFTSEPSAAAANTAGVVTFSLNASGQPDDLLAFLKNVETQSSQFLVIMDSVDFAPVTGSGRMTGSGRVFFR
jgi:hypothetical protein